MSYTNGLDKPSDYFNTSLWSGDGNAQTISGVGFQPDFLWAKNRSDSYSNILTDSVRGITKQLKSEGNASELTNAQGVTAFNADGYVLGTQADFAVNGNTFVGWSWKANGAGSANTDGSINSTVSVNTTAGFSIVSYTGNGSAGATVGHGLGSTPKMIIVKRRNTAAQWNVYHESLGNTGALYLNDTIAFNVVAGFWNNTSPNSTTFTLGTDAAGNGSGDTYITYCFAEKTGYSKFGSYTGNGNADGTFVYTGFKPAFVIVKRTDATQGWYILDNKRNTFNPEDKYLEANDSDAEATFTFCDFLSNGFKARTIGTGFNASGGSYIYMAFAEEPLVGDNPATAR
jgi:hypothetical protein